MFIFFLAGCGGGSDTNKTSPIPPPNVAPVVELGPSLTAVGDTDLAIQSQASDSDGTVSSYSWAQIDGVQVSFTGQSTDTATLTLPNVETTATITFELTVTDDDGANNSDTISITIEPKPNLLLAFQDVEQSINFQALDNLDSNSSYYLQSSFTGETLLNGGLNTLNRSDVDEVITVVNSDGQPVMLGRVKAGTTEFEISALTTATTLLINHPLLSATYEQYPARFEQLLASLSEVDALADTINADANWIEADNPDVINAIATAILTLFERIDTGYFDTINTVSKQSITLNDTNLVKPNRIAIFDEPLLDSGVAINIVGENTSELNPSFTLNIQNTINRYVNIMVDGAEDNSFRNGKPVFMLPPAEDSITNSVLYDYGSKVKIDGNEATIDEIVIEVYGPGTGSLLAVNQDEQDNFIRASLASAVRYQVIPTLSTQFGMKKQCLVERWFNSFEDGTVELKASIATDVDQYRGLLTPDAVQFGDGLSEYTDANYVMTGLRAWVLYSGAQQLDITICALNNAQETIEKKYNTKLADDVRQILNTYLEKSIQNLSYYNKLFAGVIEVLSLPGTFDNLYTLDPNFELIFNSAPKQTGWILKNEHVANASNIDITAEGTVPSLLLLGRDEYGFSEACNSGVICKSFVFERSPQGISDFNINIATACENDDETNKTCRNVVFDTGDNQTIGGQVGAPTLPLNKGLITHAYPNYIGEKDIYEGEVFSADLDGAYTNYPIKIMLEEARPDFRFYVNDAYFEAGENNVLTCEEGETQASVTLKIINVGVGSFYLDNVDTIADGGEWRLSNNFLLTEMSPLSANEQSRILTYSCISGDENDGAEIVFQDAENSDYSQSFNFTVKFPPEPVYEVVFANSEDDGIENVYQTIKSGDEVTLPNSVLVYAGLKLNGQLVDVKSIGDTSYKFWRYQMPIEIFSSDDVTIENYEFTIRDLTNDVDVRVPIDLTVSNQGYRTFIGKIWTIERSGVLTGTLSLTEDYTYEVNDDIYGLKNGTWRVSDFNHRERDHCSADVNAKIEAKAVGSFKIEDASRSFNAAEFVKVLDNGYLSVGACNSVNGFGFYQ